MDLSLILARLQTELSSTVNSVGVAADLEAAMDGVVAMPALFVLPLSDRGEDVDAASSTDQRVPQTFGVVLCVSNQRDAQGAAALGDLHPLRQALKKALVGWVPDASNGEPVTFDQGNLLSLDGNGRLWWIDRFRLTTYYWSA